MRYLAFLLVPVALAGCTSSPPRVEQTWRAAADSQRTSRPTESNVVVHRDPARPLASKDPLSKEQVLDLGARLEPQEAIAEIDRHPLAFPLSKENIRWFEDRVAPPELVDYLKKRSAVNWEALATPPAPTPPPPSSYESVPEEPTLYVPPERRTTTTTVYVEAPPEPTVVYERDYVYPAPVFYGGVVYVGGGWGRRDYCLHSYRPRGYYAPVPVYRPGVPAGVFPQQTVVRTGDPTVYVRTGVRTSYGGSWHGGGFYHR